MDALDSLVVQRVHRVGAGHCHLQVLQQAVVHAKGPTMHGDRLTTRPGIDDDGADANIDHLLHDVQVAQRRRPNRRWQAFQQLAVAVAHVLNVANPVVGHADARAFQSRLHPRATVVADHHDVLHLQPLDRELNGRQRIEVRMHHDVGDVAVHKHLARLQAGDLVGGHAAVGAANPHVFGRLLLHQAGEKAGALGFHLGGPGPVEAEKGVDRFGHGLDFRRES